jgi:hypothetical protein
MAQVVLIGQFEFVEWTPEGRLRHSQDKMATEGTEIEKSSRAMPLKLPILPHNARFFKSVAGEEQRPTMKRPGEVPVSLTSDDLFSVKFAQSFQFDL